VGRSLTKGATLAAAYHQSITACRMISEAAMPTPIKSSFHDPDRTRLVRERGLRVRLRVTMPVRCSVAQDPERRQADTPPQGAALTPRIESGGRLAL
jgi:hypothetical protein